MRFVGIRLSVQRLPFGRSLKRLIGLGLSVMTFGIGFLGIVFGEQRRGWEDSFAATDVLYDERRPEPAPWSLPESRRRVRLPRWRRAAGRRRSRGFERGQAAFWPLGQLVDDDDREREDASAQNG